MNSQPLPPLLEVGQITKRFPGVLALDRVDLVLHRAEILAVIGENGAGKTTLMKILAGVDTPDGGRVRMDGKIVAIDSVRAAVSLGIALIHQELNLLDNLDVGANIFLGREPQRWGTIDRRRIDGDARRILAQIGLDCPPRILVGDLSVGRQQMVEIAKAMSVHARILIMDEPTSSLSRHDSEQLFRVVKDLQTQGVSILYISHRLREVKQLADRVLVLRDGRNAGELRRDEIDHHRMVKLMVGRDVSQFYQRRAHEAGQPVLEVRNLRTPAHPQETLSFTVHAGEIVAVAGLVGAGRSEMLQALFGVQPALGGTIRLDGKPIRIGMPPDAVRAGIALVPEDRKQQGLIVEMALRHNISLAGLHRHQHFGFLNRSEERQITTQMIRRLNIRTPSAEQVVQYLSGGNQQKVVLAKWLALKPRVLLLDEPTRGIDVGSKPEIYLLMEQLARQGAAILFVSSEMEEILGVSDRTLVMHEGRIAGQLTQSELNEEAVMQLATGYGMAGEQTLRGSS